MKLVFSVVLIFVLALVSLGQTRDSSEYTAQLTGNGKGKAVWKIRDRGRQRQAELGVEGERLAAGSYEIVIGSSSVNPNGVFRVWVTTDAFGAFEFDQRFIGANRPAIEAGMSVEIFNQTGNVVLSGSFVRTK